MAKGFFTTKWNYKNLKFIYLPYTDYVISHHQTDGDLPYAN